MIWRFTGRTARTKVHVPPKVDDKTVGDKEETKEPQMRRHKALVFLRVLLALPGPVFLAFSIQQYFDGIGSLRSLVQGHIGLAFAAAVTFATLPLWLFSLLLAQIHHTVDFDKPESLHGRRVWTRVRAFESALFLLTAFAYILLYSQDRVFYVWAILGLQPVVALALYSITNVVRAIINHQGSGYHTFALARMAGRRQRHFLRMRDALCSVGDVAHSNRRPLDCGLFRTIIQWHRLFG